MDHTVQQTAGTATRNWPHIRPPRSHRQEWVWLAAVGLLLGLSGTVRYWREWQFENLSKQSEAPPFPLRQLSKDLGSWREVEGTETTLDPQIARTAGSTDNILRTYENQQTGEKAVVMVLYGLANLVWGHTPEVCYPAAGFQKVSKPEDTRIDVPDSPTRPLFRRERFAKSRAGTGIYEEVYHSFLNAGQWGVDQGARWKSFRYHPGMLKIQVQRQITSLDEGESESVRELLGSLVREIERQMSGSGETAS